MTTDYGMWNALVSTLTLLVVAATAFVGLRQVRHLRGQNTLQGLLKILDDWRDPHFQAWLDFVRIELPKRVNDPEFLAELDRRPIDRSHHVELNVCDWYEQVGSYLKYGLLDEAAMLDTAYGSAQMVWRLVEPVIDRMRRTRGDELYENFEYMVVRCAMFERKHPHGTYPAGMPRMRDLRTTPVATTDAPGVTGSASVTT